MTLAYLTTPLLGIVDTAVVGQFGETAMIGGLAVGAIVLDVIFTSFNFLRAGTTAMVAQAFGAGDEPEERAALWRAVLVSILAGILIALLSPVIISIGGWFMSAGAEVTAAMATYVGIRILAAPISLTNYALLGYVLGRGEGVTGFALQLLLNGTNIVLSIYLGLHLNWAIEGVAWATVVAEVSALICGFAYLAYRNRRTKRISVSHLIEPQSLLKMFSVNGDIMIRSFVLLSAFALFTRSGAGLGELPLATNAILMNFFMVSGFLLDGFATAAEQLSGRSIGARYQPAFHRTVVLTAMWGLAVAAIITLTVLIVGPHIVAIITSSEEIRAAAAGFLPWAAFTALSGVAAFQMDGVYIGAAWSRDMRNMMLLSFVAFVVSLPVFVGWWGNHGNWAALHVFLLLRGATLYALLGSNTRKAFQDRPNAPSNQLP
ncbi:MAG: MATE family efflux transporter [Rhizobiaceae bacterium]